MHLLVDLTVVLIVLGRLEALRMIASIDLALLRLVLPEVEALCGKHFRADG